MQVSSFAESAQAFCAWAESSSPSKQHVYAITLEALTRLSEVYAGYFRLPDPGDFASLNRDIVGTHDPSLHLPRWKELPFSQYVDVETPHLCQRTPALATHSVAEDLTRVYECLKRGLLAFQAGRVAEANDLWSFEFEYIWGEKVIDVMRALHRFLE